MGGRLPGRAWGDPVGVRYGVDMLPFTRDEFFAVFESYNAVVWPAQLVLYVLAVAMVVWAARRTQRTDRWLPFGLAALWLWTGVLYHWREFTAVNRMAWIFGALFVAQGVLFAVAGARGGRLRVGRPRGWCGWIGTVLLLYALVVYPLLGLAGHPAREVPFLGVPCPTTIFTFGLLFWAVSPVPRHLLVIPLLWAFFGSSAVVLLGVTQDVGLFVAGLLGLLLFRWPESRRPAAQESPTR